MPKATVLLYHRIAEPERDPQLLSVSREHFVEHLQVLRQFYHPMHLNSLRSRLAYNGWPHKSVVITFDDGYADNLHNAYPLLDAAEVPATVFVTAGQVGTTRQFACDALETLFLSGADLPDHLVLEYGGEVRTWVVGQARPAEADLGWNVLAQSKRTPRQQVYEDLMRELPGLPAQEREAVLEFLFDWAGMEREPAQTGDGYARALNEPELAELARSGLVSIGAHTMTHPRLSALSPSAQRTEIANSRQRLEELLNRQVPTFAYPFGSQPDYDEHSMRLAREAGFTCACSNFQGHVGWGADPYQLPRFLVRDWDGDEFARRMQEWMTR